MKKVHLSVTNDVFTDQRVNKMARTLHSMGFAVTITGVMRPGSHIFNPAWATIRRFPMLFQKGFLFYAEYNVRLFFLLLFRSHDLLVSNDLDTLLPNHLAAFIKRKPLVYDTHEYFTGTPELTNRPLVRQTWKLLENLLFPRQKTIITVNRSIAQLYEKEYGKSLYVVRNLPLYKTPGEAPSRAELGLPESKDLILLQGTGINIDRGAEELVMAMRPEHGNPNALLLIIGGGDVLPELRAIAEKEQLHNRVWFLDRMPYEELFAFTRVCDIGVSIDKDTNINYRYSLPNKLFDYIMAGTPQLVSDLPELRHIVRKYNTGVVIRSHEPGHIAAAISSMLTDKKQLKEMEAGCREAARELCWENEEVVVREIYAPFSDSSFSRG